MTPRVRPTVRGKSGTWSIGYRTAHSVHANRGNLQKLLAIKTEFAQNHYPRGRRDQAHEKHSHEKFLKLRAGPEKVFVSVLLTEA